MKEHSKAQIALENDPEQKDKLKDDALKLIKKE